MRWKRSLWSLGVGLALAGRSLFAAEDAPEVIPGPQAPGVLVAPQGSWLAPSKPPCMVPPIMPPALGEPSRPGEAVPPERPGAVAPDMGAAAQPGAGDNFAQAPEAGTAAGAASFNPTMFGDLELPYYTSIPFSSSSSSSPNSSSNSSSSVLIPDVSRGAFKIADNESPRPLDRVYLSTNYFSIQGVPGTTSRIDIYREILGAEKTFLDGNASVGIRVPFIQVQTSQAPGTPLNGIAADLTNSLTQSVVGDLSFIGKYAFINDCDTGNVLSGGLVVTAPTGPRDLIGTSAPLNPFTGLPVLGTPIIPGTLHDTLLQPYLGGIYNMGRAYVHGFSSILVPTDSRDVTYAFADVGLGYFLVRSCPSDCDRLLTALVPTFEFHANDPLNHRGPSETPVGGLDIIDLTAGVTAGLGRNVWWSMGASTPVTGPRPFQYELQSFLNYRF